ncbi:MAG: hypothetical protein H6568_07815 [Lewinellaceae bacterium]|nr:hypothetical protein [Saprospiraceae bacterium]MCB9312660.1 hypothetical protein [Lewinellaceae bacterium]
MGVKRQIAIVIIGMLLIGFLPDLEGQAMPTSLTRKYQRDAARLTLRLSGSEDELRYASVTLPSREVNRIFEMLKAAYEQLPAVQNLSKCHIHTSSFPPIDQLQVIYRKDAPWARSINQGLMQIDHPVINELLTSYNLVIDRVNRWTESENALTIRARKPMNIMALGNEFQSIQGVTGVDVREGLLQANDIEIAPTARGYEFRYILRFSGVNSGEHYWRVEVTQQMKATLVKEGGDPIPEWVRCLLEEPVSVSTW